MSGTGNNRSYVTSTGDQIIDGVISGYAWGDAILYYAFPTSASAYTYSDEPDTFAPISQAQRDATAAMLDTAAGTSANDGFSVEGFTGLNVRLTTGANAHIRSAQSQDANPTAHAYYPGTYSAAGDVWYGDNYNYTDPKPGTYAWLTHLHELGHALGLKHGQESNGYGALPYDYDAMEYSVMTYRSYQGQSLSGGYTNETYGYAQTYMISDIAALQHMYGADFTTNSGGTVYSWNPDTGDTFVNGQVAIDASGNRIFASLWDGGGVDTYDLSAYQTNLQIDLNPGASSAFSNVQIAHLGNGNYASGNIYNALQYQNDTRSLIENAVGGSGDDVILGNGADNTLWGNDGHDSIKGGDGNDIMNGGDGNDYIRGQTGDDIIDGGNGNDYLVGHSGFDTITGGDGIDTIKGHADDDNLYGGGGNDVIRGNANNDLLDGGDGDDILIGHGGDDSLTGGAGNDDLRGGGGFDTLDGGAGDDRLFGKRNDDILTGGTGADTFVFLTGGDHDRITDFDISEDFLELDAAYWNGISSAAAFLATYATVTSAGVVFNFGGGDTLTLDGVTTTAGITNASFVFGDA